MNRCYFPKRYIVVLLGFFGMFNTYSMRVNLSVALVAMVVHSEGAGGKNASAPSECPVLDQGHNQSEEQHYTGRRFDWSPETQGRVLSSYFYGYFATGFFGGYAAERFGAARVLGLGHAIAALLTLLTPLLAVEWGAAGIVGVRTVEGIAQGFALPAMTAIISRWSPEMERTRISAVVLSGMISGSVVTMWVAGWLCSTDFLGGWPSVFYVTGSVTCVWYVFWLRFIFETPDVHPGISEDELARFDGMENSKAKSFKVPWIDICTSIPFWAVVSANFGCLFGELLLLTELPTFLNTSLHFNINDVGMLSALPCVFYFVSMWMASYIADKVRSTGKLTISTIRKIFQAIAGYGAGLCLLSITMSGCRPLLIVSLFSLALFFKGFMYSGYNITHTDMSPDFAGTLYGLTNGIASFSGIIVPTMVGFFTSDGYSMAKWNNVFYVTVAVYFVSTTFFILFASAEPQPWGKARSRKRQLNSKTTDCLPENNEQLIL